MNSINANNLFMIGGPNGAGKTTSAFSMMPELIHCEEYVNADAIAASLSPFKPESISVKAGKLMLARIYELAKQNVSFAFETTMASADRWSIDDNSTTEPLLVAEKLARNSETHVYRNSIWDKFEEMKK